MAPYAIRLVGDPVLRQHAHEIDKVDAKLVALVHDMIATMYDAPGVGLAAPQVGVQKRLFVYDLGDGEGARTVVNPVIVESRGEFVYEEGCLSIPDLYFEIMRPDEVHLTGYDLDGNEVSVEAEGFVGRVFQHELDHLNGVLMLDLLDDDRRKEALAILRERQLQAAMPQVTGDRVEPRRLQLPGRS
ncbi:MAG: peptide deformylase [Actinobacteria bacterium]|nr:peptide deformylase [Actinomycetota bacterium]MBI3257660.1 peptide deformylase [Actinomycetota bacterium]